ncbi:zf-TFIIB domain-containing protein [Bradyrhizobium sediminis]|uniref:Zf-TFIIB domain-containing protein n=1 Tax=Bradyrhizobium sediminis TaxID=2840469 RepID=A0A975RN38_9BRAD|nr:zf-TFIIB domain-containing protein [Bradyrhizobium sediminis]
MKNAKARSSPISILRTSWHAERSLLPERHKQGRCPRCRSPLKIFKVGGRTAYYCPRCQGD